MGLLYLSSSLVLSIPLFGVMREELLDIFELLEKTIINPQKSVLSTFCGNGGVLSAAVDTDGATTQNPARAPANGFEWLLSPFHSAFSAMINHSISIEPTAYHL